VYFYVFLFLRKSQNYLKEMEVSIMPFNKSQKKSNFLSLSFLSRCQLPTYSVKFAMRDDPTVPKETIKCILQVRNI
jgi:hypothetical protein